MTEEVLDKKIREIVASRGRKNTDHQSLIRQLEVMSKIARIFGPRKEIPVLMHLIAAIKDNKSIDEYLDLQSWRSCHSSLTRIVSILNENKNLVLSLFSNEDAMEFTLANKIDNEFIKKKIDEPQETTIKSDVINVVGSLDSFLTRLEEEYIKSLQQINPHTQVILFKLIKTFD